MNVNNEELQREKNRYEKYQRLYIDKARESASKYLQKLEELPGEPKEFEYFKNILKKVFIENEVVKYKDNEKFIGSLCVTMPNEVISAAGARAVNLCGNTYAGFHIGDYAMPRDICPSVKSVVGNVIGGINETYKACDMYVVPVSCGCKKKLAEFLSDYKTKIPLYLPINRTDDYGIDTYVKEIKKVADKISEITGIKVTRESLANQIKTYASVQKEIERFSRLRSEEGGLIRGTYALAVMNSMVYDEVSNWEIHLKKLNDELLEKKSNQEYLTKKKLPRILLTGSPITFPNIKIPLTIEQQGGIVCAEEMCFGDRWASDLVSVCDDSLNGYYKALANRYIKPCSCPIFPENETRIRKITKIVQDARIDGIIYHSLRGCLVYDYEFEQMEKYFGDRKVPIIKIESDFNDEDVEVLRIRIEAFIEMIKFKNKEV